MTKHIVGDKLTEPVRQTVTKMGQDLRSARQARRWTQADVARRAGMALATYKRMESGEPGVTLGLWLQAWEKMGMLDQLAEATRPHRDAHGERLRRFQSGIRVRPVSRRREDWDY
jgi:transcriptional regulator with XRE-family HTH domain